jgi:hypothetical protein
MAEEENLRPTVNAPPIPNYPNDSEPVSIKTKFPEFPKEVFLPVTEKIRKIRSKSPGFNNAIRIRRAEQGLAASAYIQQGTSGLLVISDGPEIEVTVKQGIHMDRTGKYVYTFQDTNGKVFDLQFEDEFQFYTRIKPIPFIPIPFVPKPKAQVGGYYPSVYAGISGATMLAPLVARQMMRMYQTSSRRKTTRNKQRKTKRRNFKKTNRNKTRSNA